MNKRITNDDLFDVDISFDDIGVKRVWEMAWLLYDDLQEHKAEDPFELSPNVKRKIKIWILFLYSDNEYIWPDYSPSQIYNWFFNLLTFGWWERRKQGTFNKFKRSGNFRV